MRAFALGLILAASAFAQDPVAVTPFQLLTTDPNSGLLTPCAGCYIETFAAGTNTHAPTYTNSSLGVANSNPVRTNGSGYAIASGNVISGIWVGTQCLKLVAKDADMSILWTQDNVCDQAQVLKALLAGATGSSLIGYKYSSNAALRTVQGKLQEFGPSVKDFGATGDGTTNDTAALIAAIASASSTIAPLTLPCGKYNFSSTLEISSRIVMQGGGQGGGTSTIAPCTTLTKVADVVGIKVNSGATFTKLAGFRLTSTASTGTSSGIQVGTDDDGSPNGAGEVRLEELVVDSHKGHGIDVQNGNVGVLDHVFVNANGIDGVHISSPVFQNANAWRLYSVSSINNIRDGINLDIASSTVAFGFNTEGNGRYGIYANRPYMNLQGYSESNVSDNEHLTSSCFDCYMVVRDVQNKLFQGSTLFSYVHQQAGTGTAPSLDGLTGRFGVHGMLSLPLIKPTFGDTILIDNNLGNAFLATATDNRDFAIAAPANAIYEDQIQICIANASGGDLGAITWPINYTMSAWVSPQNGFTRCSSFTLNVATFRWLQTERSYADLGTGSLAADYVYPSIQPLKVDAQAASYANTIYTYPNIDKETSYRTYCSAWTTTAAGTGTVSLRLLLRLPAVAGGNLQASNTLDLSAVQSTASVSIIEVVPANTASRTVGVQAIVTGNVGADYSIRCNVEHVQQ